MDANQRKIRPSADASSRLILYFACATVVMAAFILYGSLYPFDFHVRGHVGADPLAVLLSTWNARPEHVGNVVGNVFLYIPLGLFGLLALGRRMHALFRLALIVALGAALCFSMELIQMYVTGRISTFADIYPNVLGTGIGALAGLIAGAYARWPRMSGLRLQPIPMLLLSAFLAYRLFPYVPSLDLHQYWQALKPVVLDPRFGGFDIARYAVVWLVVATLGQALVGAGRARLWLTPAMLFLLCAQVAIMQNSINAPELVGAGVALVAWLALSVMNKRTQSILVVLALAAFIVAERLQPFRLVDIPHGFGWIPFASFLHGSMAINTQSFLEKFFLYGGLIWLLTRAGAGFTVAGVLLSMGLLATSLMQTYLPGRSAEITDAAMALLIAALFAPMSGMTTASTPSVTRRGPIYDPHRPT